MLLLLACRWETPADSAEPVDSALVEDSAAPVETVDTGGVEVCDGVDNDGDGLVDEGFDDADGDGSAACIDCDDDDPLVGGRTKEFCDGQDNDCDGGVDEGFDEDGDGWATCLGDCDDEDAEIYPGAQELCDGLDNDCDPNSVETDDIDGDGWTRCDGDCDETDAAVNPDTEEVCDGEDNNCSGHWDELPECFACTDVDGWRVCETTGPFENGEQACSGMGSQLAVLADGDRAESLAAAVVQVSDQPLWIGATDAEEEGTWLWVDGTPVEDGSWGEGQPDNWDDSEHCALVNWKGTDGLWNDASCSYWAGFVCDG